MLVKLLCHEIPLSVLDVYETSALWEMSEDEIQTSILGKIKTELGGKIEGGHKSSKTGQEKPGTHRPKVG